MAYDLANILIYGLFGIEIQDVPVVTMIVLWVAISGIVYEVFFMFSMLSSVVSVRNLPDENGFHGFHVHDERSCKSMMGGGHYNPMGNPHPQHAGDMPPLLANDGMAFGAFYTNRFYPEMELE